MKKVILMVKKNVVTDAIDGFFGFISTGYPAIDKFFRRLAVLAVLLAVVIGSISSLGGSYTTVTGAIGTVYGSLQAEASEVVPIVEEAVDTVSISASTIYDEIEAAVAGTKVTNSAAPPVSEVPIVGTQ
jgi:hypothetical protein